MPHCPSCGTTVEKNDAFCSECGADVTETETAESEDADKEGETDDFHQSEADQNKRIAGLTRPQQYVAVASAAIIIGAFLPWFSASVLGSTVTVQGIERDGVFTLIAAAVVLGLLFFRWTKRARQASIFLGILIFLLSAVYIYDPWLWSSTQPTQQQRQFVNIGIGLYLTLIGGVGLSAGAYLTEEPT